MKTKRDARSARLFWIGVPERHHRDFALSSVTALWKVVSRRRIQCAI